MTKKQEAREERLRFMLAIKRNTPTNFESSFYFDVLDISRKVDCLISMAKSLRKLYERQCNGYRLWNGPEDVKARDRDERKEQRLNKDIQGLVSEITGKSLVAVFQGDPRGASVRLVKKGGSVEVLTVPDWL